MIVDRPEPFRSVAVQMGRYVVFLPWSNKRLYADLAEQAHASNRFEARLSGTIFPWPTEPMHLLDFDQLPGVGVTVGN
jgi:hypothetical protein